ncbi:MAG: hypothetical protein QNJ41_13805 [Xenococcaceae cyanobacterium MO_188.B32]|nr:hypothetical protein [Xenococcaceae cyanobacterium MO_188.B32]
MNPIKLKIKQIAEKIINNEIDLIEGCRIIASLAYELENRDSIFFILAISSESDRFPLGKVRDTCSLEHLEDLDREKEEFITFYKQKILDSCQEIIKLSEGD